MEKFTKRNSDVGREIQVFSFVFYFIILIYIYMFLKREGSEIDIFEEKNIW